MSTDDKPKRTPRYLIHPWSNEDPDTMYVEGFETLNDAAWHANEFNLDPSSVKTVSPLSDDDQADLLQRIDEWKKHNSNRKLLHDEYRATKKKFDEASGALEYLKYSKTVSNVLLQEATGDRGMLEEKLAELNRRIKEAEEF